MDSSIETLMSLGFSEAQVRLALEMTSNDPDTACELLFSGTIPDSRNLKLIILVRQDLGMSPGKVAAQVAHAALKASRMCSSNTVREWSLQGEPIIVLKVENLEELTKLQSQARQENIEAHTIQDAGRTEVQASSTTVCSIGPDYNDKIDRVTGHLSLY